MAEAGDVQIFKAVAVEIGSDYAVRPAGIRQAGLLGHVGERAVAIIVIEGAARSARIGPLSTVSALVK